MISAHTSSRTSNHHGR